MIKKLCYHTALILISSLSVISAFGQSGRSSHSDFDNIYFRDSDTLHLYDEDEYNGLEPLDSLVPKYKVFLTGENHTYTESNARLWLKMIKYLHKNAGVRNIIFEYGFSYGYLVNEYLQTGDTNLYNSIKNFAYVEYSNVLKDLYKFNASLDSSEKIYLCAIDIERGVYPIAKLLDYLLPDSFDAHDSIIVHLQSIQSLASYNDSKLEDDDDDYVSNGFSYYSSTTLNLVQKNFRKFEEEYKAVLGDNFDLFKEVITDRYDARNKWYKYENDKAVQQYVYRETYMHQQFLEQYRTHEGGWFGQFGRCHTTQDRSTSNSCEWYNFNSLANRIKNTRGGSFRDSVMTIGIIYRNDRGITSSRDDYMEEAFDKYFDELPDNGIVLFDFSDDEKLDSAFSSDFNFFFLNTHTDRGEVYEYLELYDPNMFQFSVKLTFHRNDRNMDLEPLNDLFTNTSASDGFGTDQLRSYEVTALYGASVLGSGYRNYGGLKFGYFIPRELALNGGPEYKLSGFYITNLSFWNLLPRMGFLDIMGGFGYGYGRLKMTAVEQANNPSVGFGFIGNMKNTIYYNPAFLLDFAGRADINIAFITIGAQIGYTWDVSKKNWKSGGEIIGDSPKTSFSGVSQNFFVGLNF